MSTPVIHSYQDLRNLLKITDGTLTIDSTMAATITQLITDCYGEQPIVITQAQPGPGDGTKEQVVVAGTSSFLSNLLPLVATFWLDSSNNVQATLNYALIGAEAGPDDWKFSSSFPDLPTISSLAGSTSSGPTPVLDALQLTNSVFIVSTTATRDSQYSVDVKYGINFIGQAKPSGLFGVLLDSFSSLPPFCLYGTITLPKAAQKTPPITVLQYPWDLPAPPPGILLQADLGTDIHFDKIAFNNTLFKIYCPTSTDWLTANPTFEPAVCFSGKLAVPSADISVDISGAMAPGDSTLLLRGEFQGISVQNLESLVDIAGANNLLDFLPDELKKAGDRLEKLEFQTAAILLTSGSGGPGVAGTYFTVGMPDASWHVWQDDFIIDKLAGNFSIKTPFSSPQISVTVAGQLIIETVAIDVSASSQEEFTVYAALDKDLTLPLTQFVAHYFPAIATPADLTIDKLQLGIAPKKWYSFALAMADAPHSWQLPIGPTGLTVSDVVMNLRYPAGGPVAGSAGGTIALGTFATVSAEYTIPGDITLRAALPDVQLRQLIGALTDQAVAIPDAFNLDFKDSSLLLQKQQSDYVFQLATDLENFGLLALQVQKDARSWGVAVGLDMAGGTPSSLPGLSFLAEFEQLFALDKLLLIISSFAAPGFTFPDTAAFDNPALGTKTIALPAAATGGLIAGMNFYGEWTIKASDSGQNLLMKFLGTAPVLGIALQVSKVPSQNSRLFVSYSASIQGHPLTCEFGGMLVNGSPALFLTGTMPVSIQGQLQTFDVTMLFVANGAFLSADMKGATSVKFGVFSLANLALEIGIDLEGIPSLGVAATIDVETIESSVAVFFDSADPSKSLVAGAVSDLHLGDVLNAFTAGVAESPIDAILNTVAVKGTNRFSIADADNALATDLDNLKLEAFVAQCQSAGGLTLHAGAGQFLLVVNTPGTLWYYTDMVQMRHYAFSKAGGTISVATEAQFYCAPQATKIATMSFPEGFYINGAIEFLGLTASMTLGIDPQQGISLDATMDKLVIGDKALFSLTDASGSKGPVVSLATYTNAAQPVPAFRPPHFYLSGQLEMLGMTKAVFVSISSAGAAFDIEGDLVPVLVSGKLNGTFKSPTDLAVGGHLTVGIQTVDLGSLGSFSIDSGAKGIVDFHVRDAAVGAGLAVSFELAGDTLSLGNVAIDIGTQTFADLPRILFDAIKKFLTDLFKDPKQWANYAAKALNWAQDKIDGVLQSAFPGLSASEINAILAALFPVCALTQALGLM